MNPEHASGMRQVAVAVGEDALDVFPLNSRQRLGRRCGWLHRLGPFKGGEDLIGVDGFGEVAEQTPPPEGRSMQKRASPGSVDPRLCHSYGRKCARTAAFPTASSALRPARTVVSTPETGRSTTTPAARSRGPADIRDTGVPKPHADQPHEGEGSQDGDKADERRHETGTIVTARAGQSRAAGPRRSGRESEGAHTSTAARTIRPVRTPPSGG